eukprot:NODE_32_length_37098_cov_1.132760.p13 type:complete len:250 gc:universal NODE_32_length_37098_cov_1.132760:21052-21801(+)
MKKSDIESQKNISAYNNTEEPPPYTEITKEIARKPVLPPRRQENEERLPQPPLENASGPWWEMLDCCCYCCVANDIIIRCAIELFRFPFALFCFAWTLTTIFLWILMIVPPIGAPIMYIVIYSYRALAIVDLQMNQYLEKLICQRRAQVLNPRYTQVPSLVPGEVDGTRSFMKKLYSLSSDRFTKSSIFYFLAVQLWLSIFTFIFFIVHVILICIPIFWCCLRIWEQMLTVIQRVGIRASYATLSHSQT